MAEIEDRVRKLEMLLARIFGGIVVAVVILLGFLGYTSLYQVPQGITKAVSKYIEERDDEIIDRIRKFGDEVAEDAGKVKSNAAMTDKLVEQIESSPGAMRVEFGSVNIHKEGIPKLWNPNGCEADRGVYGEEVSFEEAFIKPPVVIIGITSLDLGGHVRLTVRVDKVTASGFTYSYYTWCDTKVWGATASWMAVGP